jgi:hypothetical protein
MIRKTSESLVIGQSARNLEQFDILKKNGSSVLKQLLIMLQLIIALLLAAAAPLSAEAGSGGDRVEWFGGAPSDRWIYGGEVYIWGANINGETTSGAPIEVDFDDLFEHLEIGFMGVLAAAKDKWTLLVDFIYLDVEDDDKGTVNISGSPTSAKIDVELKGFISTLGGAYSFLETDTTRLNLVAGARYLWLEVDLDVDVGPVSGDGSDSDQVWDGIVGLRGKTELNEKWYLTYYGDVGTGESDKTWQALAAISYRFESVDAVLGYRYLKWEFDKAGDMLNFDELDLSGPFAGVKFRF